MRRRLGLGCFGDEHDAGLQVSESRRSVCWLARSLGVQIGMAGQSRHSLNKTVIGSVRLEDMMG